MAVIPDQRDVDTDFDDDDELEERDEDWDEDEPGLTDVIPPSTHGD
jgi:hypothetical protein